MNPSSHRMSLHGFLTILMTSCTTHEEKARHAIMVTILHSMTHKTETANLKRFADETS